MGYIESNLVVGERVAYRTRLHWLVFKWAGLLGAAAIVVLGLGELRIGVGLLVCCGFTTLGAWITYVSSEFGVTDRRVLIKTGFVSRHSLEMLLEKVEGIGVDQGFWGRLFGFGSIVVTGTGGTKERFEDIANPLEFRRYVQEQISSSRWRPGRRRRIDVVASRRTRLVEPGIEYQAIARDEWEHEVAVAYGADRAAAVAECVRMARSRDPEADVYVLESP